MKIVKFTGQTGLPYVTVDGVKKLLQLRDAPGPNTLLNGNESLGYYGWWNDTGDPSFPTRANVLAVSSPVGWTNLADDGWLKFAYNGKILYIAKKPLMHGGSWDSLYTAGLVYGTGDIGPFGTQLAPYGEDWTGASIRVTGTLNPANVASGTGAAWNDRVYYDDGTHNGATVYYNEYYYIWWDGVDSWNISDTKGGGTIQYKRTAVSVYGAFAAVNGTGTPTASQIAGNPVLQNKILTKNGYSYKIRLMTGCNSNPSSAAGGEWDALMYRIHVSDPLGLGDALWAKFSNTDIVVATGNGRATWTQETHSTSSFPQSRVFRGDVSASDFYYNAASFVNTRYGFRPVLELIR